jgi:hypothetical protein
MESTLQKSIKLLDDFDNDETKVRECEQALLSGKLQIVGGKICRIHRQESGDHMLEIVRDLTDSDRLNHLADKIDNVVDAVDDLNPRKNQPNYYSMIYKGSEKQSLVSDEAIKAGKKAFKETLSKTDKYFAMTL